MNSSLADAAGASPTQPASLPPAARPAGAVWLTLVRREFWEHRYLWSAPLVTGAVLAVLLAIAHGSIQADEDASTPQGQVALTTVVQWALSVPFCVVLLFTLSYYALDSLYAERKDRSILFWKSLPVSDGLTVTSKLLMAVAVVPLGMFAFTLAVYPVYYLILSLRMAAGGLPAVLSWDTVEWLRTELMMLLLLVLAALWYAPVTAYLMLVSAWARRSPFLWATLPVVVAPLLESLAFRTHYLWDFIRYRTDGIWFTLLDGAELRSHHLNGPVGTLLHQLNFRGAFLDRDLWLGVAATAVLVLITVRVRRYRDDT